MTGLKFKIAHKRAGGEKWSATPRTQRKRDLKTGRERQLTALGRGFTIGDFDISPDGRELIFDRSKDQSDVVLIERPK
jgi:hypothetical protein